MTQSSVGRMHQVPAVLLRGTRHSEKTSSSADSAVPGVGHELQLAPARHARAGRSAALTVCSVACPLIKEPWQKQGRDWLPHPPQRLGDAGRSRSPIDFFGSKYARATPNIVNSSVGDSMTD